MSDPSSASSHQEPETLLPAAVPKTPPPSDLEAALRANEERLRMALDAAKMFTWDWDLIADKAVVSTDFTRFFALPEPQKTQGLDTAYAIIHPDDLPVFLAAIRRAIATGEDFTAEFRSATQPERWFAAHGRVHKAEDGTARRMLGVTWDITERKQAEEALRRSEARFRALVENTFESLSITDAQVNVLYVSPGNVRVFGRTPEQVMGTNGFASIHPEDLPAAMTALKEVLQNPGVPFTRVFRMQHQNGSWRWIEGTACNLLHNPHVRGITVNMRDITDSRLLQEQLMQAHKMESIGRLAGGIAHDFNNILTAILGYTELMEEEAQEDRVLQGYVSQMRRAAERAAALTAQLLAFARKRVVEPKVVSINDLTHNMEKLLRRLLNEDIELTTRLAPDLRPVKVDTGHFEQILINLVVNARDAMPNGGRLLIETQNVSLMADYALRHNEVVPGNYVLLAVTDTGMGISEEMKRHIFEPFFTTKEVGKGTGLGLATCYGLVKQAGGAIWVYSEPGHGTTFKVYLPQVEAAQETPTTLSALEGLPGGTETILVAEDEPMVREIAVKTLSRLGYHILSAGDGEEALAVADAYPYPIHLLLTDMVMPHLGGREVAEAIRRTRPEMRVLYASGYTDNAIVQRGLEEAETSFLQKPFIPAALARKVREMLDAAPEG